MHIKDRDRIIPNKSFSKIQFVESENLIEIHSYIYLFVCSCNRWPSHKGGIEISGWLVWHAEKIMNTNPKRARHWPKPHNKLEGIDQIPNKINNFAIYISPSENEFSLWSTFSSLLWLFPSGMPATFPANQLKSTTAAVQQKCVTSVSMLMRLYIWCWWWRWKITCSTPVDDDDNSDGRWNSAKEKYHLFRYYQLSFSIQISNILLFCIYSV